MPTHVLGLGHTFNTQQPFLMASLVAQGVKNLPAVQKTWVRSLSWEDPLEKEMATHSSVLDWRIPVTAELGGLPSMGSHRVGHDCSNLAAAVSILVCKISWTQEPGGLQSMGSRRVGHD